MECTRWACRLSFNMISFHTEGQWQHAKQSHSEVRRWHLLDRMRGVASLKSARSACEKDGQWRSVALL
eukprot:7710765-Karenia_brevis.AAC.1